jgi:hypothetical protein
VANHINTILEDFKTKHKDIKPTFYLSYSKEFIDKLALLFEEDCSIIFDPEVANHKANPVMQSLLRQLNLY